MKGKHLLLIVFTVLLLSGCGSSSQIPEYAPQEEKKLVVYTSHKPEVYESIVREFEERTGIWVEVVTGGTNELLELISREQDVPQADVMFGGGVENLEAYQSCFSPYVSREASSLRTSLQDDENDWTPFSALPIVLVYNPKLVTAEQLTSWMDLQKDIFRGKIAFADPTVSGSSFTALATWMQVLDLPYDECLQSISRCLDGRLLSGSAEVLEAVEDGDCLAGITLEETARKHIADGSDLTIVYPIDGTSCVPDGVALIRGCAHSDNAKQFLDFVVSRDVQQQISQNMYRRPARLDVLPNDALPPMGELTLIHYDLKWVSENRELLLSDWLFYQKEAE